MEVSRPGTESELQPPYSDAGSFNLLHQARDRICASTVTRAAADRFFFSPIFGPNWHMEVPRLGVDSEL